MSAATEPVIEQGGAVEIFHELTPDALKEAIEREKKMRAIIITYYREAMVQGHHYYNLPGQQSRKPSLSKEGALNLCSLFKVYPDPEPPFEIFHEDGHYSVRTRVHLRSLRTGQIVATGDGFCSTRESKYAYRWEWGSRVPSHLDKENLPTRQVGQNKTTQYRVDNEDLADQYNTVLKMSFKRGAVGSTCNLPLVSEIFTQDVEDQIEEHSQNVTRGRDQAEEARNTKQAPKAGPAPAQSKPENEREKINREIGISLDTLATSGHPKFRRTNGKLSSYQILEHVRGISLDRNWGYERIESLSDLSEQHLGEYAGILEGEIQAMKEEKAEGGAGINAQSDLGI